MDISIISERENPLLSRREIWIRIRGNATPKVGELKERLSAEYEGIVVIDRIISETGTPDCIAYVKVYKDEETMKRIERRSKLVKSGVISDGEGNTEQEGQQVQT